MDKALIAFGVWIGTLTIITALVAWFTRDREPLPPPRSFLDDYIAQGLNQIDTFLREEAHR